jgi:hypothetical protein
LLLTIPCSRNVSLEASYALDSSVSEGGILHLQDGANRLNLSSRTKFIDYAKKNASTWYAHANVHFGWNIRRDTLYLITGCDKATSWGAVSFSDRSVNRDASVKLMAHFISANGSYNYWETSSAMTARVGPDSGGIGVKGQINQCLFVRGFRITVRDMTLGGWKKDFVSLDSKAGNIKIVSEERSFDIGEGVFHFESFSIFSNAH